MILAYEPGPTLCKVMVITGAKSYKISVDMRDSKLIVSLNWYKSSIAIAIVKLKHVMACNPASNIGQKKKRTRASLTGAAPTNKPSSATPSLAFVD